MGVKFTEEQKKVIELRDRNILVSAAAGSGKTAVLVERVLTRLYKDPNPLDIDRLLIVTYTEAAAAEMRERIRDAIETALEKDPQNMHLQRQSTLVYRAQITTIHGFCLNVIREYCHMIDLDPSFRVGETGELNLLKRDVLNELLEGQYEEASPAFLAFAESYAPGRDDRQMEELILKLYEHSRSYPDPGQWLLSCVEPYDVADMEAFVTSPIVGEIMKHAHRQLEEAAETTRYAILIAQSDGGPGGYEDALCRDLKTYEELLGLSDFVAFQKAISEVKWKTLGSNRGLTVLDDKINLVKELRAECKNSIKALQTGFFYAEPKQLREDLMAAKPNVEVLSRLVIDFGEAYRLKKHSKNILDFDDMLYFALQILTEKQGDTFVPSVVAKEYQEQFVEVMIDEYQDSNLVQDTILTSVSRVPEGRPNIFMVGDVKQSIYRFRLSRPELFMEKYDTYSDVDGPMQKVDLHKNFRSRNEVLVSANYVFDQLMTKGFGGVSYDEKAALNYGASYEAKAGYETEVWFVNTQGYRRKNAIELEAWATAKRIKELVGSLDILDKKTNTYRKAGYGDIVILFRSLQGFAEPFQQVFMEAGIPAYSSSRTGYFQVREIQTILDYLRILDNPRQDIPLAAVLVSMFGNIKNEEMAKIQSFREAASFYEKTRAYAKEGADDVLREKLQHFFAQYDSFRSRVPYTAIHILLWNIMQETGYANYVAALPAGEQRAANLDMLLEKAIAFESTSYKGLFHFVRYIEQLQKYEVDYGEANLSEEGNGVVRFLSIHKSKGLEFPIVFVVGMEKKFNTMDTKTEILIHPEWGVGLSAVDLDQRTKTATLMKSIIQKKVMDDTIAEELRILYVAMTRAKEKLILMGAVDKADAYQSRCVRLLGRKEKALPYSYISGARSYFEWIVPALFRMGSDVPIVQNAIDACDLWLSDEAEQIADQITKEYLEEWDTEVIYDTDMHEQIARQFAYEYPYRSEQKTKQKISVSELKKRAYLEEDEIEEEEVIPLLPRFLQEALPVTGALRGTSYHKVLELLEFGKEYDVNSLEESLKQFVQQGYLTKEMKESVSSEEILNFLQSDVGQRVALASRRGVLHKEQPFVVSQDDTLVQGIIDVYFEEDGEWIVLDYKTDRLYREEEYKERYQVQLDYYAKALERITEKPVKEKLIYSFTLQACIKL